MRRSSLEQLAHAVDNMTRLMGHKKTTDASKLPGTSGVQNLKRSCQYVARRDSATLFCSGFNSTASIKQALAQIREDGTTLKIRIQDLILCGDDEKLFAVQDFLIQTTTELMVVPKEDTLHQPTIITDWKSIDFVDCISSRERYVEYKVKRKRFVKTMKQYYRMVNRTSLDLPLSFRVKLELNAPMDIFSIIQLLQEIVHDPSVQEVVFPDFLKESLFADSNQAAEAFASMVDKRTLRWSGHTLTLFICYKDDEVDPSRPRSEQDDQQQWKPPCRQLIRQDQFVRGPSKYNSATVALLKECAINLEKLTLMHSCLGGGCRAGSSLSILSSTNSRRASVYGGYQS